MPKRDFNNVAKQLEITLQHWCSPVNLLHIFKRPFSKNISKGPLLRIHELKSDKISVSERLNICKLFWFEGCI